MRKITRVDAMDLGLTRFNTGKPCSHGHYADHYTYNGSCVECMKLAADRWKSGHKRKQLDRLAKARRDAAAKLNRHRQGHPGRSLD